MQRHVHCRLVTCQLVAMVISLSLMVPVKSQSFPSEIPIFSHQIPTRFSSKLQLTLVIHPVPSSSESSPVTFAATSPLARTPDGEKGIEKGNQVSVWIWEENCIHIYIYIHTHVRNRWIDIDMDTETTTNRSIDR